MRSDVSFFSGMAIGAGVGICAMGFLYSIPLLPMILLALLLFVAGGALTPKGRF